jgi:hypothetical protein
LSPSVTCLFPTPPLPLPDRILSLDANVKRQALTTHGSNKIKR